MPPPPLLLLLLAGSSVWAAPSASSGMDEVKDAVGLSHTGPKYNVQLLTGALPPASKPPAGTKSVVMTKKNGKKYRCYLPSAPKNETTSDGAAAPPAPRVASYLMSLKGTCFYRLEGWWTYEFCYQKSVRQFHQEKVAATANKPESTKVTQDYTLGAFSLDKRAGTASASSAAASTTPATSGGGASSDEASGAAAGKAAAAADELREDAKTRKKYWSQLYTNGTKCDMTGRPRETEVRLQCSPGEPSFLASIEEVSTCRYLLHFSTNLLCKHPGFAADQNKEVTQAVQCEPLGPDGSPRHRRPRRRSRSSGGGAGARALEESTSGGRRLARGGGGGGRVAASAGGRGAPTPRRRRLFVHAKYNYRGVVVGVDPACMQSEAWMAANGVALLKRGGKQPFYHVLPDVRDRPGAQVTYVAHENVLFDTPPEPLTHPLVESFFSGFDAPRGRHVPTPELLAKYPPRRAAEGGRRGGAAPRGQCHRRRRGCDDRRRPCMSARGGTMRWRGADERVPGPPSRRRFAPRPSAARPARGSRRV